MSAESKKVAYKRYHAKVRKDPVKLERKRANWRKARAKHYAVKSGEVKAAMKRAYRADKMRYKEARYKVKITRPVPGICEGCRTPFAVTKRGACLDHDHTRNEFRGWLCHNCNCTLGYAKDSRERLLLLVDYLDRYELLR